MGLLQTLTMKTPFTCFNIELMLPANRISDARCFVEVRCEGSAGNFQLAANLIVPDERRG